MKKLLLIVLVLIVIVVVGGVIGAVVMVDSLARKAIEDGGTYALGVDTTVSDVDVGLLGGTFEMDNLRVANPASGGFRSDHFLTLGSGGMAVSLSTLRAATVELPSLGLIDIDVNLEKREGKTNYGVILENLKKVSGPDEPRTPEPAAGDQKRFIIRDLQIKNVAVHVDLVGGPGAVSDLTRVTVPIDLIRLTDVGKTGTGVGGTGVTMGELARIIVKAVLSAAAEKGGGVIPADVLGELQSRLAALGDIEALKMEVVATAQAKVEELGKKAVDEGKKALEDVKEKGKEALDEAADKLKGLIPGDKKK